MKKIYALLFLFFVFNSSFVIRHLSFGQSPQGINYQAVARDVSGNPLATQSVTVTFNIYPTNPPPGVPVYSEAHSAITNTFGLFNLVIGSVNPATFSAIQWGKDKFYLEVIVNGNNMGWTQFISVPYAFHSTTADSLSNPPSGSFIWKRNADSVFLATGTNQVGIGTVSPTAKLNVETIAGSEDALNVTHKGKGRAGVFWTNNSLNDSTTLISYTNGNGNAMFGINEGAKGHGGVFAVNNSSSGGYGLIGSTNGIGKAVFGLQSGMGYGGVFWINNPANDSAALVGMTNGNGTAVYGIAGGSGNAGFFEITNTGNSSAALHSVTNGTGNAISGYTIGTGKAGIFQINNLTSNAAALYATTNGIGPSAVFMGGNVGIGTITPSAKLEVAGQIKITDGTQANGRVLTSDAGGLATWQTPPTPPITGFSNMQVFSTAGTFTFMTSPGVTKIMVEVWGSGGGGGGGNGVATSSDGGGGGAGGYGKQILTVTPSTNYTVVVGAGGAAQAAGANSSFGGAMISATGGSGGNTTIGGNGGTSTATFNVSGGTGSYKVANGYGGFGGASSGSSGGMWGVNGFSAGAGIAPGGGGGGGAQYAGFTSGGNGAPGRVVVWW